MNTFEPPFTIFALKANGNQMIRRDGLDVSRRFFDPDQHELQYLRIWFQANE
jgi:hypothetical protein